LIYDDEGRITKAVGIGDVVHESDGVFSNIFKFRGFGLYEAAAVSSRFTSFA
jgi:hypothetical protein